MFSKISVLGINLDNALCNGLGYALSYYVFYGLGRGIPVPITSCLMRGFEFFLAQCLSEVIVENLSHTSLDLVRYVKAETRVDALAAIFMAVWTSYSITGGFFSWGLYPPVIGLAVVGCVIGGFICRLINHERIVGLEESLAIQANDFRGKLEFRPQMANAPPAAIDNEPAF